METLNHIAKKTKNKKKTNKTTQKHVDVEPQAIQVKYTKWPRFRTGPVSVQKEILLIAKHFITHWYCKSDVLSSKNHAFIGKCLLCCFFGLVLNDHADYLKLCAQITIIYRRSFILKNGYFGKIWDWLTYSCPWL